LILALDHGLKRMLKVGFFVMLKFDYDVVVGCNKFARRIQNERFE
jgi:hypothetical protein